MAKSKVVGQKSKSLKKQKSKSRMRSLSKKGNKKRKINQNMKGGSKKNRSRRSKNNKNKKYRMKGGAVSLGAGITHYDTNNQIKIEKFDNIVCMGDKIIIKNINGKEITIQEPNINTNLKSNCDSNIHGTIFQVQGSGTNFTLKNITEDLGNNPKRNLVKTIHLFDNETNEIFDI